jgi:hypothetical protein
LVCLIDVVIGSKERLRKETFITFVDLWISSQNSLIRIKTTIV